MRTHKHKSCGTSKQLQARCPEHHQSRLPNATMENTIAHIDNTAPPSAPASPCSALKATSTPMVGAKMQPTLVPRNSTEPAAYVMRRPKRSACSAHAQEPCGCKRGATATVQTRRRKKAC
jgi:hypothetical protein